MQQPAPNSALSPTQDKYRRFMVGKVLGFLLQDEHAKHIVAKAKATDPVTAISEAVAPALETMYQAGTMAKAQIEMVTVLVAGTEITAVVAEMLSVAGVIEQAQIPDIAARAAKAMVDAHNAKVQQGGSRPQPGMAGIMPAPKTVQ